MGTLPSSTAELCHHSTLTVDAFLSQPQDLVDTARITTNDVGAVLESLGVEAARATLLTEIGRVFGVYGIGVDARHLNLIADFMMHQVAGALYL